MNTSASRKRKLDEDVIASQSEEPEELIWSDDEGSVVDGIYIPAPLKQHTVAAKNSRLIILKIVNNFFKSYAENQILGPFSKCFNAIVGPNGSGKSNVIDSMLFVFGYRATRIRCKKLSVLLHNSDSYRNVQSCCVAVHFCEIIDKPGDQYEIVPGSEFVVSRTANKDNSSFYEVNGKRVQFKEVAKLLRHHGIDLDHNRFLILQGEVEEIALMKSKGANENETGMLEYLEDIIGTSRYKQPLEKLKGRIEDLSELRTEKLNRITLIEKQVKELKAPMEEAMAFLKTENKIVTCKNFIYQRNMYDLQEKAKEFEEDKAKVTETENKIKATLKSLAEEKLQKEEVLNQEMSKYDKLNQKKDQLKEAFNVAEKKDVQLQVEQVQTNKNRKKFKQELEEEKKKLIKLEKLPDENAKLILDYETREVNLRATKQKIEEEKSQLLARIRDETAGLQVEKEDLETKLGHLKEIVAATKSAYDLTNTELKLACSKEETAKENLEKLIDSIKKHNTTLKITTDEIGQLQKKIPLTEKSLQNAQNEFDKLKKEEVVVSKEIAQKKMALEETQSLMRMSKSRGRLLDMLMQQKREGNCPGFYGRLGDLGAIDLKYDVAVSTACGPLDYVVVDTVETANWCVDFLKKNGLRKTTFIALDKQEHLRNAANTKIQTPENAHRLFDLIKVQDEAVKTAFYYGLRDTLVADDLDQATRIAYGAKRYRVVTLKGDLIETSGTMSGGGKSVSKGRMGQSVVTANVNPKEIEQMESKLESCEARLAQILQKEHSLQNQINALQPELNTMKMNLTKHLRDQQSLKEQQPLLQEQLKRQEDIVKSTKSDKAKIKKLEAEMEAKKLKFEKASEAAQEIQVLVDELTKTIEEKTTGKLRHVEKNLAEVNKTIEKCKAEITKMKVAITTAERNAKKSAEKIGTLEQNILDAENKLRAIQTERETIEVDVKKLYKCIEEITEELQKGELQFAGLKQEVATLTEEENKLRFKKVDVEQMMETINEKLNECNSAIHNWTAKLSQLQLHEIPEDDCELKKFSVEELLEKNVEKVELDMQSAINAVKNSKPNLNVIEEYKRGQKVCMEKVQELEEITNKRNRMKNLFDQVKNQRKDEFMIGYNIIRLKLKEMYQMITLGGDADFEILDVCDPFADGVQFNVRPPKKSWKAISNLSGGEKTLSSLALVFALHYYKPSPLYVMDEIDAALDFKNVSIVGHYIKERTKNAQFIIISLRSNMFELCDNLIGIYKTFNCTKSITVDPRFDLKDANEDQENKAQNGQN